MLCALANTVFSQALPIVSPDVPSTQGSMEPGASALRSSSAARTEQRLPLGRALVVAEAVEHRQHGQHGKRQDGGRQNEAR